jgi:hypothetical protein
MRSGSTHETYFRGLTIFVAIELPYHLTANTVSTNTLTDSPTYPIKHFHCRLAVVKVCYLQYTYTYKMTIKYNNVLNKYIASLRHIAYK